MFKHIKESIYNVTTIMFSAHQTKVSDCFSKDPIIIYIMHRGGDEDFVVRGCPEVWCKEDFEFDCRKVYLQSYKYPVKQNNIK